LTQIQRQVEQVRAAAAARVSDVAELAARICEVPAPTGDEGKRAQFVCGLLSDFGYTPEIDDVNNVYVRRGRGSGTAVMLAAHTDTVFPASTDVSVTRHGTTLHGPGIGDNCLGVAAMLGALRVMDDLGIVTDADIIATANVGEEGLGNLRGVRAAVDRYREDLGALIAVEGHNLGRVTHVAVGSVRWRITVTGPGGHSWGAFGKPSAIHGLGRIISAIAGLHVASDPKTTFNVGVIEGGTSVNTIAPKASALVDMRSVDPAELRHLVDQVGEIAATRAGEDLEVTVEVLGERPAGATDQQAPIVVAAGTILKRLGFEPVFDASSTDANIPISLGIPAVCVGISRGGNGHTTNEYIEVPPIELGLTQLVALRLSAASLFP
jgi:acetylornithine deacetylase/succinyl-diaminopimelate desuccinylase-like protein